MKKSMKTIIGASAVSVVGMLIAVVKYLKDEKSSDVNTPRKYDFLGYDEQGYDNQGYDRQGYDKSGYDRDGFDRQGFNKYGWDKDGYNKSGRDSQGYNRIGYNSAGFNRKGYNPQNKDISGNKREYYKEQLQTVNEYTLKAKNRIQEGDYKDAAFSIRCGYDKCLSLIISHEKGFKQYSSNLNSNIMMCQKLFDRSEYDLLMTARKLTNQGVHDLEKQSLSHDQIEFCLKRLELLVERTKELTDCDATIG